jgi:hypothetical protein
MNKQSIDTYFSLQTEIESYVANFLGLLREKEVSILNGYKDSFLTEYGVNGFYNIYYSVWDNKLKSLLFLLVLKI